MFCSPHPKGSLKSLSRLCKVGPITSPDIRARYTNTLHLLTLQNVLYISSIRLRIAWSKIVFFSDVNDTMVEVIIVYGIYKHPTRKQFTNHKCSSSFWSRHHVLWDSKCESLIVVVIRVFLPPNLELPYWAPACRKAYVPHLDEKKGIFTEMISKDISWSWNKDVIKVSNLSCELACPSQDDRFIGWM